MATPIRSSKEKILRTARRLLVEEGHERLSLRDVARRAGFAPSSLYEHFPNRQALLQALAVAALEDLRQDVVVACAQGAGLAERLMSAALAYLSFANVRRNEFELVFSRPQDPEMVEPAIYSPLLPVVAEISRASAEGECAVPEGSTILDLALGLWTQVHGMAVLRAAYLARTIGFEDKAKAIIAASIRAWGGPLGPGNQASATRLDEAVEVVPYDDTWPYHFATELGRLSTVCHPATGVVGIEHFGSTAVPGLAGKPVIDVLIGVGAWPPSDDLQRKLGDLGYESLGEAGVPGRIHLRRRGPVSFNLALVRHAGPLWRNNLRVRDQLRESSGLRRKYAAIKRRAIAKGATTLLAYSEEKRAFIESLVRDAPP